MSESKNKRVSEVLFSELVKDVIYIFLGGLVIWPVYNHSYPKLKRSLVEGTPLGYLDICASIFLIRSILISLRVYLQSSHRMLIGYPMDPKT